MNHPSGITNIAGFLDAAAAGDPGRAALVLDDGTVWGYGALHDEVGRWASTLAAAGIGAHRPTSSWRAP